MFYDWFSRHGDTLHNTSWATINRQFGDVVGNILAVIDLILSIPATSVEAERGFSIMKRVKTDFHNRLTSRALNDLLLIILLSPPEAEFEPEKVINHWFNTTESLREETLLSSRRMHTRKSLRMSLSLTCCEMQLVVLSSPYAVAWSYHW